ncbi:MAG: TetR family transcriptional regulator [Nocardioidaceae bacterium]|nr:MAG: TetR family transcriptional regulator [Nocardioidaceae bacterium]
MIESAKVPRSSQRREQTHREIVRCAQVLADEHGLDGFTMDELAEAVGVSRRTLFNYVPSKIDAVLGADIPAEPEPFTTFRLGGPTGDLVADIRLAGANVLRLHETDAQEIARFRRLLRNEPRLAKAVYERLERIVDILTDAIIEREAKAIDVFAARVIASITLCLFHIAMDEFMADSSIHVADHFLRAFDNAATLFN